MVQLSQVRETRRRELAERRVRAVLDENRAALGRLFATGLLFTQKGSRAGRELLGAHQTLHRILDLFARLAEDGNPEDGSREQDIFVHLDEQLRRSSLLTARTGEFLAGRGRE